MMLPSAVAHPTPVEALIPHRAPFVLVDEIQVIESGVRCSSSWRIRPEEPVLAGHFPGNPILPGVLLVEHAAQTACALVAAAGGADGRLPVLAKIEECRFHGAVRPGDVVRTEVAIERSLGNFTVFTAESRIGRRRVLHCRLVVSMAASTELT